MEREEANEVYLSLAALKMGDKTGVVVVVVSQDLYLRKEMKHAGQTVTQLCSLRIVFTMNINKYK